MVLQTISLGSSISIHALREEGDFPAEDVRWQNEKFLSTPSARRATNRFWLVRACL